MAPLIILYGALAVFVAGNLVRILRIATMPAHLRWELYPVPHEPPTKARYGGSYFEETDWWTKSMETSRSGEVRAVLQEVFFLKGVWKHNRQLWLWSWLFHAGLYFLILETVMVLASACAEHANVAGVCRALQPSSVLVSWLGVLSGTAGSVGLLIRRTTSPKLRPFTSLWAYLNLLVILSLFGTGLLSLLMNPTTVNDMTLLAGGLLAFHAAPHLQGVIAAHVSLLALFLAYFPFTHMTHMYMKYFTYHAGQWDDTPYRWEPGIHASIARSLGQPVSWAAPHIRGDGRKTWIEIAAEEGPSGANKN